MSKKKRSMSALFLRSDRREPSLSNVVEHPFQESNADKILVVAHNHPELYPGGGEILAYQLFKAYEAMEGVEARFLAATGDFSRRAHDGTPFLALADRPNEFIFHNDRFNYTRLSNQAPEKLKALRRFLLDEKPDIIHLHHLLRFGVELLPLIRHTLPEAKIFLTLHDFIPICRRDGQMIRSADGALCASASPGRCAECFPEISPQRFKLRELSLKAHLAFVDGFISPSEFLAQRYRDWGLPAEKIHVIANGTPEVVPVPHREPEAGDWRGRFAYFGQISEFKGMEVLLDACEMLKAQGVTDFNVAIHGNVSAQPEAFQARFQERVRALSPQVEFHGRYSSQELPARMASADWVLTPSIWWENSPLVIAEAFRHQRPVICSGIGGMAELVTHEQTGLHFLPGSAADLAAAMHRAMGEDGLWDNCVGAIAQPPSTEAMAGLYHALFRSVNPNRKEKAQQIERVEEMSYGS